MTPATQPTAPALKRSSLWSTRSSLGHLLLTALTLGLALATEATGQVPGVSREEMWPAPTAADWAKPCQLEFQRSYDDAQRVSKETSRPILVCVNMDGEIASEHYAGIRYRDPELALLFKPYVCLIASVYRHTPRDYDEAGQRVPCPRFGSVTCGEHIRIEPQLFGELFEGQRVAPRHIMLELDGSETYDVFYAFDTASVFETIEKGISEREIETLPLARGDRTIFERAASSELSDRLAVERAFLKGDAGVRRQLLEVTRAQGSAASTDLLRLAIFGFDPEIASLARGVLAQARGEKGAALIAEALRVPMEAAERDGLVAALEQIDDVPWAATLAAAHRGLAERSKTIDPEAWAREAQALEAGSAPERERLATAEQLERATRAITERPEDPATQLEAAEAFLALVFEPETDRRQRQLARTDAGLALERATQLGASGWRVDGIGALLAYADGDVANCYQLAENAVAAMPPGEYGWTGMKSLSLFAEARRRSIRKAARDRQEWPKEWFADVHAAYSALARHPLVTDTEVVDHYDFLRRIGASGQAGTVLTDGLERFPESWELHTRLRGRVLWERGVSGLEATYDEMLRAEGHGPNLEWFAGYAALVAAEFQRRRNEPEGAFTSYDNAILHYERGIAENPKTRASADHYVALALAGRARLWLERGELESSLSDLLASFERSPDSAASLDGIGISAVATSQMLRARLTEAARPELVQSLQNALDGLAPEMLLPPAFEAQGPGSARPPASAGDPSGPR